MAQFQKGQSGNPRGRPKGPNKATQEVLDLCRRLVRDKAYLRRLTERMRRGKVAPAVETMVWAYAFGKPKDILQLEAHVTTDSEAAAEARESLRVKLDQIAERIRRSGQPPEASEMSIAEMIAVSPRPQ